MSPSLSVKGIRVKAKEEIPDEGFSLTGHWGTLCTCGLATSPLYVSKLEGHKERFIWG